MSGSTALVLGVVIFAIAIIGGRIVWNKNRVDAYWPTKDKKPNPISGGGYAGDGEIENRPGEKPNDGRQELM